MGTVCHPERSPEGDQDVVPQLRSRAVHGAVRQTAAATLAAEAIVAAAARIHPAQPGRLATAGALVLFRSGWEW